MHFAHEGHDDLDTNDYEEHESVATSQEEYLKSNGRCIIVLE